MPNDGVEFANGEILVTYMTTPNMVKEMIKSAGIVTEVGGRTCHAALVARELGKPCIIAYPLAMLLRDGDYIEMNAKTGEVKVLENATSGGRK